MSKSKKIEKLTPAKMNNLFGANHKHITYYNYNSGELVNFPTQDCASVKYTIDNATELQYFLMNMDSFKDVDIAACCIMYIPFDKFPGIGKLCEISSALGIHDGNATVGTLIFRNKKTGKIITPPPYWMGYERYTTHDEAKELGIRGFAYDIKIFPEFLRILRSIHRYQK